MTRSDDAGLFLAGLFLGDGAGSVAALRDATAAVLANLERWAVGGGPWSGIDVPALAGEIGSIDPCPADPAPIEEILAELGRVVLAHGVRTTDPACAAHLHAPVLVTAAAAELAIAATNQSMDSFDQAPAATLVEDHLVRWLGGRLGLDHRRSGVLTSGGTASNQLALVLARRATAAATGVDVDLDGLGPDAARWRIVTSTAAHASVTQAASTLGLGRRAVVAAPTDRWGRVDLGALDAAIDATRAAGERVIAIVGTAGTTDLGAVDPLAALAERADGLDAWFHVDAAVGGAFVLSPRLAGLLDGIDRADSVTVDFHKLWWQPIAASALLVADGAAFDGLRLVDHYLHRGDEPRDDDLAGQPDLVARSLETSRRFDALKVIASLRATGARRMGAMLERVVDTAGVVARLVDHHPALELLAPPATITVVFRWNPAGRRGADLDGDLDLDRVNVEIQRRLLASGRAVIGRTRLDGAVALKLTIVNPLATVDDLAAVLDLVAETGDQVAGA